MKLPVVSGEQAIEAFGKTGYEKDRQRGSHVVLRHVSAPIAVTRFLCTGKSQKAHCAR